MHWTDWVLMAYLGLLLLLSINGLHRLWMVWVTARNGSHAGVDAPANWPKVTVQLPLFNERDVSTRLIDAICALDYDSQKLQIQVLDDSTDDTTDRAAARVLFHKQRGVPITYHHRTVRTGFKAGALQAGLRSTDSELIAVFDADFMPEPDFLKKVVPYFQEPEIGMVQTRWGHLNADESMLTYAQATLLDAHFAVEHQARYAGGRWFNFNGTAGIWRRQAIADAGGWQHDTLTEDLDLSYRAQLAGWRFQYLDRVVAPAELPPNMASFKSQQHRWAKGSVQTARKLLSLIWSSDEPFPTKLEAHMHLTANFSYPLVVVLSVLMPVAVYGRVVTHYSMLEWLDFVLFLFAVLPFVVFYGFAVGRTRPTLGRFLSLPVVFALGLGMAVSQSVAVFEGLFGEVGQFIRTPKRGDQKQSSYKASVTPLIGVEILLAVYLIGSCMFFLSLGEWASIPFMCLFAAGYSMVAVQSLRSA